MCRFSRNMWASIFWNPQDLSRPAMGLLYLFTVLTYQDITLKIAGLLAETCGWRYYSESTPVKLKPFCRSLMRFVHLTNTVSLVLLLPLFCRIRCLANKELKQSYQALHPQGALSRPVLFWNKKCRLLPYYPQLHTKLKFCLFLTFRSWSTDCSPSLSFWVGHF